MTRIFALATLLMMTGEVFASAAAEGGAEPTVFAGSIIQSISAAIVFLVLLVILYKAAWGPILKGLQDRELKIKADLENAEKASRDAKAALDGYNRKLAEAQQEAGRLIGQARADAEKVAAQLRHQAEAEINTLRQRATADIAAAKEQAVNELYEQAGTLATQVAGQILRREIKPGDQQALINESLSQLKSRNN